VRFVIQRSFGFGCGYAALCVSVAKYSFVISFVFNMRRQGMLTGDRLGDTGPFDVYSAINRLTRKTAWEKPPNNYEWGLNAAHRRANEFAPTPTLWIVGSNSFDHDRFVVSSSL